MITGLAEQTALLLQRSAPFAAQIRDRRLSAEVAVIQRLAEDLTGLLLTRDPLSEHVHHSKPRAAWLALGAVLRNCGQSMNTATTPAQLKAAVSGSSFYAGMRILPKAEREAMYRDLWLLPLGR